jgi:hypothetical protein
MKIYRKIPMFNKIIFFILLTIGFSSFSFSAEFGVLGAGNAKCLDWNKANGQQRIEIKSWMMGFTNAEQLELVYQGNPAYRLELFTDDYLKYEINNKCALSSNSEISMLTVLLDILTRFPKEK